MSNISSFSGRRVIRNGKFNVVANSNWDTDNTTSIGANSFRMSKAFDPKTGRPLPLYVNANDNKIRDNRVVKFGAFGVWNETGHLFSGNHWFHGDGETNGIRKAGLIFTTANPKATVVGNFVDNNFIEITNEHDAPPDFGNEFAFGGMTKSVVGLVADGKILRSSKYPCDRISVYGTQTKGKPR